MSREEKSEAGAYQVIQGEGHQIAGNDIHNHTHLDAYQPSADSPNLQPCKICEWPISAVNPVMCGNCGHNYAEDRAIQAERERRTRETLFYAAMILLALVVGVATYVSGRTSLSFIEALVATGMSGILLWSGWCWLRAWGAVKWQRLTKRWKE